MKQRMCPCYGLSDLVLTEQRIRKGEVMIDTERTYAVDSDNYGLITAGSGKIYTVNNSSCYDGSDMENNTNLGQNIHCSKLPQFLRSSKHCESN